MTDVPPAYGAPVPAVPRTNGNAVAALICGLFSLTCCLPVAAAGLWLGVTARRSIKASAGAESGDGLAIAGIVLSAVGLVLGLAFWALWILVRIFPSSGSAPAVG